MNQRSKDSKPRTTKNSQRLYNLEEQEKLYKSLGISAMANSGNTSGEEQEELREEDAPSQNSGSVHEDDSFDERDARAELQGKKAKRRSKESVVDSDNQSDKDPNGTPTGKEKKIKRKRKAKSQELEDSQTKNKQKRLKMEGLAAKGANGKPIRKGKKSPLGSKVKGRKSFSDGQTEPIVLPKDLMVSPEDSSVITAHMNAYTKWLMDNNMLVSQQSLNNFQGTNAQQSVPSTSIPLGSQQGLGASMPELTSKVLNQRDLDLGLPRPIHDISADESSNMDTSEMDGTPPFIPQAPAQQAAVNVPPQQGSQQGVLFKACEAEKEVAAEDEDPVGPVVSDQMCMMVKNFLGRSRKSAKIDDLLLEFLRPKNMSYLKSPKIEDEIYQDLGGAAKHFDKNCRNLQGYLHSAITALVNSLQPMITIERVHPIISEAGLKVKKAIQLLSFATKELNDRRKDALKSAVNPEYVPLLKHAKPPSDDWLLGGELNESIKKCDDSKKLSDKIMKNRKNQQNTDTQSQPSNSVGHYQNQDKFKYKNKGRRDNRSYYRNYPNYQANQQQQQQQIVQPVQQHQPPVYNQGFGQHQQPQNHLWHQYQQQLQQAQAAQVQAQQLGFHQQQQQQQQWKGQTNQQPYNNYNNQKRKN